MPFSRLILASQLMLAGVPAALAQEKCASLDQFVQTLSRMHEAKAPPSRILEAPLTRAFKVGTPPAMSSAVFVPPLARAANGVVRSVTGKAGLLDIAGPAFGSPDEVHPLSGQGSPLPPGFGPRVAELQALYGCLPADFMHGRWQVDPQSNAHITGSPGGSSAESLAVRRSSTGADRAWRDGMPSAEQQLKPGHVLDLLDNHNALIALMSLSTLAAIGVVARSRKTGDARRSERHTCHKEVAFRFGRQTHQLTIVDVGRFGVKCRHSDLFRSRRSLQIQFDKRWLGGKVVWYNGTFAGIRMARPLTDAQIAFLCEEPAETEAAAA